MKPGIQSYWKEILLFSIPLFAPLLLSAQHTGASTMAEHTDVTTIPAVLQTPEIVSINRMPMKAHFFAFPSKSAALTKQKETASNFLSLNGWWKFNWVQNPADRPLKFYEPQFNDAGWTNFPVPANWELNGYGLPIYVNHPYEFTGRKKMGAALEPPFDIPTHNNPVGSYRKFFDLPQEWKGKQVFIHLGAVKSAFFIWINGKKVGYSEDSKLAAEFDITPFLQEGKNLVALEVYRWSDGSYLECQDMWRISGIERDVFLYATPKLNIRDFKASALLDPSFKNGTLQLQIDVHNHTIDKNTGHSKPARGKVQIELIDPSGKSLWEETLSDTLRVLGNSQQTLQFSKTIPQVKTWSAETPWLYTLLLTLKNEQNETIQVIPHKIGFRSVEIHNGQFLLNGKRILLKGVNRHEHHATKGHVLSKEDMRKDMEMMKKLNVNAVRHSHYPPDPYWLELCDEYGLYVVDEANIESHGRYYDLAYTLGNDKKWRNPHLERIQRMYERDKNHTSVITWSLGNEAGNGVNFYEAYDWLKKQDQRPVQYERAEYDYNTDMIVPQYPSPNWLARYPKNNPTRPLIMSEYAHIMGNSLGNFQDYWNVIENTPMLQGGFIWEWIDQAIDTVKNGKRILAYGGDFPLEGPTDENISDNNFCVKGVVTAHREVTPMALEVKKVYQHLKLSLLHPNTLQIKNNYFFRTTQNLVIAWSILENGKIWKKGTLPCPTIAAQDSALIVLKELTLKTARLPQAEYHLQVAIQINQPEPFLEKNYSIAEEQFLWKQPTPPTASNTKSNNTNNTETGKNDRALFAVPQWKNTQKGKLQSSSSDSSILIQGKNFSLTIHKFLGILQNYIWNKDTLLLEGPSPDFWRAPTDNDIGAGYNRKLRAWRTAWAEGSTPTIEIKKLDSVITVTIKRSIVQGDALAEVSYSIYSDGAVRVSTSLTPVQGKHTVLLRFGTNLTLHGSLQNIEFFGRGPGENYQDRKASTFVGHFKQKVQDQYFPYARPQESGNHTDTRYVKLQSAKGNGLMFVAIHQLLSFSAIPYHLNDLDPETEKKQYHSGELVPRDQVFLHVDLQQTGLQGIDSWGSQPLEQYRIPFAAQQFSYWIQPIGK